ncbi:MAG TPA: MFS transporter [Gaiellaceae bacterium]|nr:MFS transporter [Gaiellaceae bacterium]
MSSGQPPLRKNRDFTILWIGQTISTIGSRVSALAFPLLVLATTHSPARAGIVGFANGLPNLCFYLPAGALVDRWNRKRIMLVADGARALALGSIPVALAAHALTFPQIAVVAFVGGSFDVFFDVAESAALPQVVAKEQLPQAIAQNQARQQGAGIVSQPLGGFLFALGRGVPFLADVVSYVASFVSLLFVRPAFQELRERSTTRLRADVVEGIVWLWRERFLRTTLGLVAGTNFAHAALVIALIVRARNLGASSTLIGVMLGLFSAGALVGSVIAPWVQRNVRPSLLIIGSVWLWALLTYALFFVREPLVLGALCGLQAVVGPPWNVVLGSYRYRLVPDRLLGRTQSAGAVVTWGTIPLGSLAAGFLTQDLGARATFVVLGGIFTVVGIAAVSARVIRQASRLDAMMPGG